MDNRSATLKGFSLESIGFNLSFELSAIPGMNCTELLSVVFILY
jgi:hypothetical protein